MSAKILVVDDQRLNRKLLAAILRRAGFEVLATDDGPAALEAARAAPPDLVLLDVMMPGMDGFEVCEALRADPRTSDVPVIFLSALGETSDKVRGLGAGAVDYVTKPFDAAEVLARVRTQLQVRRLHAEVKSLNGRLVARQQLIDDDLRAAAEIQRALIPRPGTRLPGLEVSWLFAPSAAVGGDAFGAQRLGESHAALYMLDVSGHGVPAAMLAVSASQSLSPAAGLVIPRGDGPASPVDPERVLAALDAEYPFERFERYLTIAYLLVDASTGRLRYSSAGHPPPVLVRRSAGEPALLEAGGPLVGLGGGAFEAGEVRLEPGDRLFLYTDGVVEAGAGGARGGSERLLGALWAARGAPLEESCLAVEALLAAAGHASGSGESDDAALLAAEYRGTSR